MSGLLDGGEIEIPCSNCGRKTKKTVGWLKTNNQFTCACGTKINLQSDQFRRKIAEAEAAIEKVKRALGSMGKR